MQKSSLLGAKSDRIIIRQAYLQDAPSIVILSQQLGYAVTLADMQQRLNTIGVNENHVIYVATLNNDVIVGWIHAHLCDFIIMPTQAFILGLVVDENYRRCGIGLKLTQHIEQWASHHNCHGVLVRSNIVRQQAHQFYQNIGYQNIKQSLVFYKTLSNHSSELSE